MLERGLEPRAAARVYDRIGSKLAMGEPFEGRAKALAASWVQPRTGQRLLEVGVGTGAFLEAASQLDGVQAVGLDVSCEMLRLTRERAPGAQLVRGSATAPPLARASFDWLYVGYTLDLFPLDSIVPALVELRQLLAPGGQAVLCSLGPGRSWLERSLMTLWQGFHRALGPAAVGGCRPLELVGLLERAGFAVLRQEHVGQLGTPSTVVLARAVLARADEGEHADGAAG